MPRSSQSLDRLDTRAESGGAKERWLDSGLGSDTEDDEEQNIDATDRLLSKESDTLQDLEAQSPVPAPAGPVNAEYRVPTRTKLAYLGGYFFLNLALTIYNKAVLGKFAFPWLLTTLHATSASVGCYAVLLRGHFKLTNLNARENLTLVAFSFLFTINIAMSNVSLAMVSIPFHQIMRSTVPVFTILIYRICYSRTYSTATYLSLIPLILGVGLATYGDYYFSTLGFVLTLLGVVLAALKTVVTNRLMTGNLKLSALEILLRMSPLAALQSLFYASLTGELRAFTNFVNNGHLTTYVLLAVFGNGLLAFLLNVSSFQTNKLAGALTISVCGNVKQCLTILLGIVLFNVRVGPTNGCGMLVALLGAAWYSVVELSSKGRPS